MLKYKCLSADKWSRYPATQDVDMDCHLLINLGGATFCDSDVTILANTGEVDISGTVIFNEPPQTASAPILPDELANKAYVDSVAGGASSTWSTHPATQNVDISCNRIVDVSGIEFCDGTYIGHGSSFDISSNHPIDVKSSDTINLLVASGNVSITTKNGGTISHINGANDASVYQRIDGSATDVTFAIIPADPVGDPPSKYTMSMGRDDRAQVYVHQDDTDHTQNFSLLNCAGGIATVGDNVYNNTRIDVNDVIENISMSATNTLLQVRPAGQDGQVRIGAVGVASNPTVKLQSGTDAAEFLSVSYDSTLDKGKIETGTNGQLQIVSGSSMAIISGGTTAIQSSDPITMTANDSSLVMDDNFKAVALTSASMTATSASATASIKAATDVSDTQFADIQLEANAPQAMMAAFKDGGGDCFMAVNANSEIAIMYSSGDASIQARGNATMESITTSGVVSLKASNTQFEVRPAGQDGQVRIGTAGLANNPTLVFMNENGTTASISREGGGDDYLTISNTTGSILLDTAISGAEILTTSTDGVSLGQISVQPITIELRSSENISNQNSLVVVQPTTIQLVSDGVVSILPLDGMADFGFDTVLNYNTPNNMIVDVNKVGIVPTNQIAVPVYITVNDTNISGISFTNPPSAPSITSPPFRWRFSGTNNGETEYCTTNNIEMTVNIMGVDVTPALDPRLPDTIVWSAVILDESTGIRYSSVYPYETYDIYNAATLRAYTSDQQRVALFGDKYNIRANITNVFQGVSAIADGSKCVVEIYALSQDITDIGKLNYTIRIRPIRFTP